MTDSVTAGLCRITVRAPAKSMDLAVPGDIPVAELLPTLVELGGADLAESGLEHGGWVLQRVGGRPLDEEATLDVAGLRDGEILYLRPRAEALPEPHFDDLVDGIATAMSRRPHAWTPELSRVVLIGCAVAALGAGLAVLGLPGQQPWLQAGVAFGAGLLLLAGAASASRAVGDAATGAALGVVAAAYWAYAGWLLPGGSLHGVGGAEVLGSRLLASSAAGAGAAVLALASVAAFTPLFLAVTAVAAGGALLGGLMIGFDLSARDATSIVVLATVVFGALVPALSFRLSGLRTPPLPTNAAQLQQGIDPHPSADVTARTEIADGWMTALLTAAGLVCLGCLAALVVPFGPPGGCMAGALTLLLVLHGRGMGSLWQRLALIAPGVLGGVGLAVALARTLDPGSRLPLVAGLAAVAAALAIASWTVPGRRLVPYWGRAAELLHSAAAISLLPLALWVLGVYGSLRSLSL
ncbi:type VII secretion integral membrane protein EccD [Streptomyces griseorubiginosus]|uniref:type VII secretion integral membrane protein EccD n=1 Tax=Streptomyces griseorubiginosus TaxID=67304 RepID=UPI001AD6AAD7|nr:type VII secretion integral membrane protein EccD [Streptomyces griseorubiginosus]MBO4257487.1 type VII secretion integral membrane protein EccD [Streptomyces griseorubiginosus]